MNKLWECDFTNEILEAPYVANGQWWQKVTSAAQLPGDDLMFQMQVSDAATDPTAYEQQHIIPGPGGVDTTLFQLVLGDEPGAPIGQARSNWTFRPNIQAYGRRWVQRSRIYLQPDLLEAMHGTGGFPWNFRQLWECKVGEYGKDPIFRMNFSVVWTPAGLRWSAATNYAPFSEHHPEDWTEEHGGVVVGQWFDMEIDVEFKRTNGRFTVKINDHQIANFRGKTTPIPSGNIAGKWKLAVLYTANDRIARPHWQYVDKIELYSAPEGG